VVGIPDHAVEFRELSACAITMLAIASINCSRSYVLIVERDGLCHRWPAQIVHSRAPRASRAGIPARAAGTLRADEFDCGTTLQA